tara:strand:- start:3952 stop:5682 length:1731 start_codon:yes stop_codon:yes gene_type:complete
MSSIATNTKKKKNIYKPNDEAKDNRKKEDNEKFENYKTTLKKMKTRSEFFKLYQLPEDDGRIHYYFNPFFDDSAAPATEDGSLPYWGVKGIYKAYNALMENGGVKPSQIHLPFWVTKEMIQKYAENKGKNEEILEPPKKLDNNIFKEVDGKKYKTEFENLKKDDLNNTGAPIDYRDWNMIINLLRYDAKDDDDDDEKISNDDAEKIFGGYPYACGDTLPGGYFDAQELREEVTFIGLYFNELGEEAEKLIPEGESLGYDEEEYNTEIANKYKGILRKDNEKTKYLRAFIVVKDLNHKVAKDEEGYVEDGNNKRKEDYLYVEGLCSNARGIGRKLLNVVTNAAQKYEGTKLAALTVVISYYYKLGFRFYKEEKEITTKEGEEKTLIQKVNDYLDKFIAKKIEEIDKDGNKVTIDNEKYPSIAHFKKIRDKWKSDNNAGKDKDGNYIFTIEDYHYEGLKDILQLPKINAGASWGRRGKPRKQANNTYTDTDNNITFKAYDDEAMGDMGYYMYLKNDSDVNQSPTKKHKKNPGKGGGKNSKKRTKKKARRRKRKRTKRKRRRKKKRTKKRKRRRTKKRR